MRNPTDHFYNEIYSYYYKTVTRLINVAINEGLTVNREDDILNEEVGFSDNLIVEKMHYLDEWFLMSITDKEGANQYKSYVKNEIKRPISLLEKRWLKSIISDPRIKLFDIDFGGDLEDIEPLFTDEDYMVVGKYNDGHDYSDKEYIKNFREIIKAIKQKEMIEIVSYNKHGVISDNPYRFKPDHIEYSELEDKFFLFGYSPNHHYKNSIININRIVKCMRIEEKIEEEGENPATERLVVLLNRSSAESKNALERFLIEFSNYNKHVKETKEGDYLIEIDYLVSEEREMAALHLMQFAHHIRVISPSSVKIEMTERIKKQANLLDWLSSQ